jgi:filamentous hemagglutinin
MNKNTHRLVYSRLRGMVVDVEETATADGKSATATHVHSGGRRRSERAAAAGVDALGMLPVPTDAQIMPTPGTATQLMQTPNGSPPVDVAEPSGAGVSLIPKPV